MKKSHEAHIKKLEALMKTEKNLTNLMDYFLTHLGEDKQFIKKGKVIRRHDTLEAIAKKITNKLFGQHWEEVSLYLIKPKKTDFYHGFGTVGFCGINLLFFEESGIGLLVIPVVGGNNHLVRFTTLGSDGPAIPYYGQSIEQ